MKNNRTGRENGAIIIVTMMVVFTIGSIVLVLCGAMRVEAMSAAHLSASLQAASIERGAEQYVIALLTEEKSSLSTLTEDYFYQQVGDGYVWIVRPNYGMGHANTGSAGVDPNLSWYGLVEENAKLNLNTASYDSLMKLPYMTDECAQAILDWRGGAGGGTQDSYYSGLSDPYKSKKAPFETVEEMLLVQGATRQILYGSGVNDPLATQSNLGQGGAGSQAMSNLADAHGIYDLLTVYSSEAAANGQKVNLSDRNSRTALQTMLESKLDKSRAASIMTQVTGGAFTDIFDFAFSVKLTSDEFGKIYDSISVGTANAVVTSGRNGSVTTPTGGAQQPVTGLVNIITAPRDVLFALPGLDSGDVDQLISKRQSLGTTAPTNPAWIIDVLDQKKCSAIGKFITAKSSQYSADIVAVSADGRAFKRVRIVVDSSGTAPSIVYRRDFTDRGWPMDPQLLASLRSGQGLGSWTGTGAGMSGGMTMNFGSSNYLGVSVNDRSIVCAEVSVSGGKRLVRRLATFALGDGATFEKPGEAGQAFLTFLRHKKFSASRAVVGIPAKWMIALEKEIPPSGEEQARAMLRLQAERLGVSESGEMVFDYAGRSDPARSNKVLLVGVKRQRLEQIEDLLDAAGISVVAITSAALTLAGEASGDQDVPMLLLGRQGAEMVWKHDGTPRMLRHVSVMAVNGHGPVTLNSLGSELGRTLALTRGTGTRELVLWDGIGLSPEQMTELADRSGVKVRSGDVLRSLGLEEAPGAHAGNGQASDDATGEIYAPALSLALAGANRAMLPLDFRKSRLTPRKARRVSRNGMWTIVGIAVVVLATVGLYVNVYMSEAQLSKLQLDIKGKQKSFNDANQLIDRFNYTRSYFDARPPYLDCLLEITKEFKPSERIWVTNLTLKDDDNRKPDAKGPLVRRGTIGGHSVDIATMFRFRDHLQANPKFTEVGKSLTMNDPGSKTGEKDFTMTFNFIAPE